MYKNHTLRKVLSSFVLPLFLIACSSSNQAQTSPVPAAPAVSAAPASASAALRLPDFTALVEKEGPAVVNISTTQTVRGRGQMQIPGLSEDDPFYEFFRRFMPPQQGPREHQEQSLGSGFIISDDGYILTNTHVVDGADEVTVKLTDKREFKAKVIGTDQRADVALLKIDAKGLPKVALGDPSKLKVGEWVAAIGSPFGFENSVTAGIVSAKGRSLPDENYVPFIQTDVAVNPGNSGGPLFNLNGRWSASTRRSTAARAVTWACPSPFRSTWHWTSPSSCAPPGRSAAASWGSASRSSAPTLPRRSASAVPTAHWWLPWSQTARRPRLALRSAT